MDFLPKQVPVDYSEQFFEVETYLLNNYDLLSCIYSLGQMD